MVIPFDLTHVFNGRASDLDNSFVLRSLLDCLIDINVAYIKRYKVPPLYRSGVRYGRTKRWYPIPGLYARGVGDCKSLTAALVAEYLSQGIQAEPVFRWARNRRGGTDFHILVKVPKANGYERKVFEDPSRRLGMGRDELRYFNI